MPKFNIQLKVLEIGNDRELFTCLKVLLPTLLIVVRGEFMFEMFLDTSIEFLSYKIINKAINNDKYLSTEDSTALILFLKLT